jgi:hypothetical protein
MKAALLAAYLAFPFALASAGTATQTDWSGGPMVLAPSSDWGNNFLESSDILWSIPGLLTLGSDTLFHDSFDRYCPNDWGTPEIGGTYTYEYPDNAEFSITSGVGFIDDNSNTHDPKAISVLNWSASSYVCSFSWMYTEGHSSWLTLNSGPNVVVGVRQAQDNGKLSLLVDGNVYPIEDRQGGVWKDYMIVVIGSTVQLFIDGDLSYTAACSQTSVNNIRFVTNGNGTPSDNWFEEVTVCPYYAAATSSGGDTSRTTLASDTLFMDGFNRYCPDDWGTPDIGGTYTYDYPDNADFSITDNTGFIDDNSYVHDPKAISQLTGSASGFVCTFSWKYTEGHSSWLSLNNGSTVVIGVYQAEDNDQVNLWLDGFFYPVEGRQGGVWKDYTISVNGSLAKLYIDGVLKYTTVCSQTPVDNIRFASNGNGTPSDNWFEDVLVVTEMPTSSLMSSVLDLNPDLQVDWEQLVWNGTEPSGSSISVQVRASNNPDDLGEWSEGLEASGVDLSPYLESDSRYFQYRVLMSAQSGADYPILNDISVSWTPQMGVEHPDSDAEGFSLDMRPNPASSEFTIGVVLPGVSDLRLEVFDIIGRLAYGIDEDEVSSGSHLFEVSGLPSGLYLCHARAGIWEETRSIVVIAR